jgi:hypothetical protein
LRLCFLNRERFHIHNLAVAARGNKLAAKQTPSPKFQPIKFGHSRETKSIMPERWIQLQAEPPQSSFQILGKPPKPRDQHLITVRLGTRLKCSSRTSTGS